MPHDLQTWHCRGACGYRTSNRGRWCRWCMDGRVRRACDVAYIPPHAGSVDLPPGETFARLRRMVLH